MARREVVYNCSDDVVSHWELGEGSGNRGDSAGSRTLSDNGGVTFAAGKVGNGASFNGTSQWLSVASDPGIQAQPAGLTLACWVKPTAVSSNYTVVSKCGLSTREYWLRIQTNGSVQFNVTTDGSTTTTVTSAAGLVTAGAWAYLVGWHDPDSGRIGICVNNSIEVEKNFDGPIFADANAFQVGRDGSFGGGEYFGGVVDELTVWTRPLTKQQRTWVYNRGAGRVYPYTYEQEFRNKLARLTRGRDGVGLPVLALEAGDFPDYYTTPATTYGSVYIQGAGRDVTRVTGAAVNHPPFANFDGATLNGGVNVTDHRASIDAFMAGFSGKFGYRTKANAFGVFVGSTFDCGHSINGWATNTPIAFSGAFKRNQASWVPCGLAGVLDDSEQTGPFAADAAPWRHAIDTVGGQLSLEVRLKDAADVVHSFSFPLGASPPQDIRYDFQLDPATGAVQMYYGTSAASRTQVAVVNDVPWTAGRTLAHHFGGTGQLGAAGVGFSWGERYAPFDLTVMGFTIFNALRWQDRGVGQAQRLIGSNTDLGADPASDSVNLDGATNIIFKLYLFAYSPNDWWLVAWWGGIQGLGYWLVAPTGGRNDNNSLVRMRDLTLSTGGDVGSCFHYATSIGSGPDFFEVGFVGGQHGPAKCDSQSAYTVGFFRCYAIHSREVAWRFGYGLTRVVQSDTFYPGRAAVFQGKGAVSWGQDQSFGTDSGTAVYLIRLNGFSFAAFVGFESDFEGTNPSRSFIRASSAGSTEFNPLLFVQGGGVGGNPADNSVPLLELTGPTFGTPPSPNNRPARVVFAGIQDNYYTGGGPFRSLTGGRWSAPPSLAAATASGSSPRSGGAGGGSMSVKTGLAVTSDFPVLDAAGALADADSLPAATLVVNGTDTGVTVTVTRKATGLYKFALALPTLSDGDLCQVRVAATVGGVATAAYVWQGVADMGMAADALLDRPDAIEVGVTPRQKDRLVLAATAGRASGAPAPGLGGTVVYRNAVANTKARITAVVDSLGNRSQITWDAN